MQEILTINGYAVEIFQDDCAENPREWTDSTLCTAHYRYRFGDCELPRDAAGIFDAFCLHLEHKSLRLQDVIYLDVFM